MRGQFVFWKDDERLQGYASDYLRKARKASAERDTEPVAEHVQ